MKTAIRILSGILAFFALVIGVSLLLTAIGWPVSTERFQELIAGVRQMPTVLFVVLSAFVSIAIGVIVLYGMIGEGFTRRTSALLEKNALGETYVSYRTLEQIAETAAKNRSEVKSCKTKVHAIGNNVRIEVRVVTAPTVSLLEMTHTLQDEINASILAFCGTAVGSVDVTVDQAVVPPKKV